MKKIKDLLLLLILSTSLIGPVFCQTGFVAGPNGTLKRTKNGGSSWHNIGSTYIGTTDLSSIFFINRDTGFVAGPNGTLKRTKNGGSSWHNIGSTYIGTTDLYSIYFIKNKPAVNIKDQERQNLIKIYPNPANTYIYIDNGKYNLINGYKVIIINTLSQIVFQSIVNQQQFYIDLFCWSSKGIHIVQIIDSQNNTIDIRKIILQ